MPDVLKVTSIVTPSGSVAADLEAQVNEEVSYIRTMPDACPTCVANAQDEEPRKPKLHPNCRCAFIPKVN